MISTDLYNKWIDALIETMREHELSQAFIARNIGISAQHLNNILTKRNRASQKVIEKISDCIGLSYADFIRTNGGVVQFKLTDKLNMLAPYIETLTTDQIKVLIEIIPVIRKSVVCF